MLPTLKRHFDPWLVGVVLVVALSIGRFVAGPLTGDDDYVLHNLASSNLRDVLFAFNVDLVKGEGGETVWYEGFDTLQRRYVRVVPSGLMAIEYRLFGSNPIGFKTVSLLVHLLNLVLGYGLLRRQLADPVTTAAITALLGLHPAAAECVGWLACQPILVAALASLLGVWALLRLREGATVGRRVAFVAAGTGALFSYEAAVGVPLLLVGLDWLWPKHGGRPRPSDRWASGVLLAAYPAYVAAALWNRAGTTLTDASYRAGAGEALANVRVDLANYLAKLLPMPPYGAMTYAAIGSWTGAALVAAVVAVWLARVAPSRARSIGLLAFAATLAPSLLTRAAVSVLNFPSFRQLYLPPPSGPVSHHFGMAAPASRHGAHASAVRRRGHVVSTDLRSPARGLRLHPRLRLRRARTLAPMTLRPRRGRAATPRAIRRERDQTPIFDGAAEREMVEVLEGEVAKAE